MCGGSLINSIVINARIDEIRLSLAFYTLKTASFQDMEIYEEKKNILDVLTLFSLPKTTLIVEGNFEKHYCWCKLINECTCIHMDCGNDM